MPDRQPARKEKSHSSLCLACSAAEQITFYSNNRIVWKLGFFPGLTRKGMAEDKQLERFLRLNLHRFIKLMYHRCHSTERWEIMSCPEVRDLPTKCADLFLVDVTDDTQRLRKALGTLTVIMGWGCPPILHQISMPWALQGHLVKPKQCQLRCPMEMGWDPSPAEITGLLWDTWEMGIFSKTNRNLESTRRGEDTRVVVRQRSL